MKSIAWIVAVVALATFGCKKQKSEQAKAECAELTDVAITAPGAMRGAEGAGRDVIADRFERVKGQLAGVAVTDPKLKALQDDYVALLGKAIGVTRDKSINDADFMAWMRSYSVQENGVRNRIDAYCMRP